ncbi:hypothetical protein Acsp03_40320 [Actinomadura sp. NBRC 104412]|uniref:hypothetical protein n=1 Tax=Actinomadura sp. NBRC 104412 TaxID=3032203 RepID=UPI00249FD146|nr:hypothetical protein [Actinomadura sp. NBRC 104412]GLZ06566.1 hypothetical protein Acsp03_40320 [Actinomadura sp. NBRC 104412]
MHGILTPDRWGVSTWGRSDVRIRVVGSPRGKKGIVIHCLDDGLTSASTHVIAADRNERIEVRPWTLLQINGDGGTGRWHLRPGR